PEQPFGAPETAHSEDGCLQSRRERRRDAMAVDEVPLRYLQGGAAARECLVLRRHDGFLAEQSHGLHSFRWSGFWWFGHSVWGPPYRISSGRRNGFVNGAFACGLRDGYFHPRARCARLRRRATEGNEQSASHAPLGCGASSRSYLRLSASPGR